jgi:hypothetical protein
MFIEDSFGVFRAFDDCGAKIFVSGEDNEILGGCEVVEKSSLVGITLHCNVNGFVRVGL